jgi:hypothetical protein
VTLTLPLDTSVRELPAYQLTDWLDESIVAFVTAAYGNCPAWLLQNVFAGLSASYRSRALSWQRPKYWPKRYAKLSPAFRDWLASDVTLPVGSKPKTEKVASNDILLSKTRRP